VIAEELYTMTSPPARTVLAENLQALMKANPQFGTLLSLEQATATRGGGKKIGKTTLGNILAKSTPVNLDYVEILAKVFGLAPWQMLVPGLRPDNPQILRSTGAEEEALYRKLEELRTIAKQIDELDTGSERTLAAPIVEEHWHGVERRAAKRGGQ
jgi:hypothetical protein